MPNKKSKSLAEGRLDTKGIDIAPDKVSLHNEAIPKSAARVLNAQTIRDEFRKKRKLENESGDEAAKSQSERRKTKKTPSEEQPLLKIQPGESLQHFNRRVEDHMRPLVKSAMQTTCSIVRTTAKHEKQARAMAKMQKRKADPRTEKPGERDTLFAGDSDSALATSTAPPPGPPTLKEFATADSVRRRLSDVVQAPPEFKKLPNGGSSPTRVGVGRTMAVVSASQRLLMETEREKVITRYRELKASRRQTADTR